MKQHLPKSQGNAGNAREGKRRRSLNTLTAAQSGQACAWHDQPSAPRGPAIFCSRSGLSDLARGIGGGRQSHHAVHSHPDGVLVSDAQSQCSADGSGSHDPCEPLSLRDAHHGSCRITEVSSDTTIYTYECDLPPRPDCRHDVERRVYEIVAPDGQKTVRHDRGHRILRSGTTKHTKGRPNANLRSRSV